MQEQSPRVTAGSDQPGSTVPLSQSRPDEMIGRVLGSYKVVKLLGEGGMGAVYMGEHPAIGSKVAIKVLHPRYAADQRIVERFFNEARAVNIIGHDNIVKILDFNVADGSRHYFVMDFLHGRTLQSLVQATEPVPLRRMAPIVLQCCRALQAAHEHGIVHRDFKPDNVFLIDQGEQTDFVKLVDFGIAKLNESSGASLTQTGAVMGTPAYMSPEQAGGEAVIDARSDVYSLGVTIFQMATGKLPFADAGPSFGKLLAAHLQQQPPLPRSINPGVPKELEAIILKTLEKDPARRFQSMSELHDAFLACMESLGVSSELPRIGEADGGPAPQGNIPAHRSGAIATPARGATIALTERHASPARERRSGLAAGIGVGVVLVAAAFLLWRARQPSPVGVATASSGASAQPPSTIPTQNGPAQSSAGSPPPSSPAQLPGASAPGPTAGTQPAPVLPARLPPENTSPSGARLRRSTSPDAAQRAVPRVADQVPEKVAVSFRCGGPQEVCGPLRSAVEQALAKAAVRSVRDPSRADVRVEATVAGTQAPTSAQFGTTFAVRTYSIDLAAEAAKTSESVAMPSTSTLSYDPSYGSERVEERTRVLAAEIVEAVQSFAARERR